MRHGVTRKRRELKDKKDVTKLFRKKPIGKKLQVKESKHCASKKFQGLDKLIAVRGRKLLHKHSYNNI